MSGHRFNSTGNAELRAKIDEAKQRLPLPELMKQLGLGDRAKKRARCVWHDDQHPSFSVFKGNDRFWHYKCFVCDSSGGDEITFLVKHFNTSRRDAIKRYLEMAGFPPIHASNSREYPACANYPKSPKSPEPLSVLVSESLACPESPECPVSLASPVSNGQAPPAHALDRDKLVLELKAFAARNAFMGSAVPDDNTWGLARDLKAVAKRIGRKLNVGELMLTFYEWHRLSEPFLGAGKTHDHYWMRFLAQLHKVRVPTGEGTISEALQYVSKLTEADLPIVPGCIVALKVRKIAALHRELARRSKKADKRYFLSYRDAAKVCDGLSQQEAHTITFALATIGVIDFVDKGKAGLNSRKAAEFRYLSPEIENPGKDDKAFDL
jgi:hypothetical protein